MSPTQFQIRKKTEKLARSPTPDVIRALRIDAGLTQADAAALIHLRNVSGWSQYERGAMIMHPAFWELFQIKVKQQ